MMSIISKLAGSPTGLRLIAARLDEQDAADGITDHQVQDDLRKWANALEELGVATPLDVYGELVSKTK